MYYRVTTYGFDAARFDEFMEMAESIRDELKAIDGLEAVHSCVVDEGQGMIVARYTSEAAAQDAQSQIQGILGRMAPFMTSMPEITAGEVVFEM